jgi:hypothetical protein
MHVLGTRRLVSSCMDLHLPITVNGAADSPATFNAVMRIFAPSDQTGACGADPNVWEVLPMTTKASMLEKSEQQT